jgi:hypothetical protein
MIEGDVVIRELHLAGVFADLIQVRLVPVVNEIASVALVEASQERRVPAAVFHPYRFRESGDEHRQRCE